MKKKKKVAKDIKKDLVRAEIKDIRIDNYKFIQEELEKIEIQRNEIKKKFNSNLTEVEELMNFLKKSSIDSVKNSITTLKEQLNEINIMFESNLNSIRELDKEKDFIIKTKTEIPLSSEEEIELTPVEKKPKEISIKSKSTEGITQDDLYLRYEKENPRKKAVWRGKETKGFLEWKKNYLENG